MKRTRDLWVCVVAAASLFLAACAPPARPAQPAPTPTAPSGERRIRIGLVTDTGTLDDKSFNASAWIGLQRAVREFGVEAKVIESKDQADYKTNIERLVAEGHDLIITVGFLMGDDTAAMAKKYPTQQFAIVDQAYFPTPGSPACPETVKDCYADGGLGNVNSLLFAEDQSGFLAGALAALMSRTGKIGAVLGLNIPPVCRFKVGFENGARYVRPDIVILAAYQPPGLNPFNDPNWGRETALAQLRDGADIIFTAGGETGNGGLRALVERARAGDDVLGIGVDQDQYFTLEVAQPILLSSAMKRVDVATYTAVKNVVEGAFKGGISLYDMRNDGVGLAPFHDLDSRVPQMVRDRLSRIATGLKDGTITTDVTVPDDCR